MSKLSKKKTYSNPKLFFDSLDLKNLKSNKKQMQEADLLFSFAGSLYGEMYQLAGKTLYKLWAKDKFIYHCTKSNTKLYLFAVAGEFLTGRGIVHGFCFESKKLESRLVMFEEYYNHALELLEQDLVHEQSINRS